MKDLVQKMDTLDEKGVDFVSLNEGIDTTTAQGRLTFHIFGALAEFERELARERTMAGLRAARERGRVGGRAQALSGPSGPTGMILELYQSTCVLHADCMGTSTEGVLRKRAHSIHRNRPT